VRARYQISNRQIYQYLYVGRVDVVGSNGCATEQLYAMSRNIQKGVSGHIWRTFQAIFSSLTLLLSVIVSRTRKSDMVFCFGYFYYFWESTQLLGGASDNSLYVSCVCVYGSAPGETFGHA
jgi:hypothetical protein